VRNTRIGPTKPSVRPFATSSCSCMPEANLFLMFTQRLNTLGVAYMVSGSVAVIIYGEPRLTHDVDLVVVLDRGHTARLPKVFPPAEFYCPPTEVIAVELEREQRGHFNIIHHETGFKADVYLSGRDPLHTWRLARAGPSSDRRPSRVRHPAKARVLPRRRLGKALAGHSLHARHLLRDDPDRRT
jgi:hypothetical protein